MSESCQSRCNPVVCQVVAEAYYPGGLEKHFIEMCNGLARRCAVHAIAHESYREHLDDTVIFHPLDLSRSRRNPRLLWQLARLLRSLDADIVHAHAKKAGYILSQVARLIPQKTVITLHNLTLARNWMKRVDGVICVSKTITESLPGLSAHVVYNGIEPGNTDQTFTYPTPGRKVLAAGRLAPAKGFDVLIEAFRPIDAHLYIAGEGDERKRLEALASKAGVVDKVHFLGYRNDLPALIEAADMVAISSRREGFSYVFAEALLAGTPVISTDVPVPCEILTEEFIVPIGDAAALGKLIQYALDHHDEVTQRFSEWFEFGRRSFTIEAMVENTCGVYRQITGLSSRKRV